MANGIPTDLEDFITNRIETLFFDVNMFADEISKQTTLMLGNGMSVEQVNTILGQQLSSGTGPFGKLQNDTKSKVTETINQSSRKGQETQYSDKDKFAWVTVAGHKVCLDCEGRSGQIMTYGEWESEGLPGTGWSVCKGYCYCVLDPTGKTGKSVKVDTSGIKPEKGASIKAPSTWSPTMTTAEAAKWNKGSKFKGTYYHGTTPEAVKGINKTGFDLSRSRTGQMFGNGVYGTKNTKISSLFAGEGGEILSMAYNVKNPLILEDNIFYRFINGNIPSITSPENLSKTYFQSGTKQKFYGRGKQNFAKRKLAWMKKTDKPFAHKYKTADELAESISTFGDLGTPKNIFSSKNKAWLKANEEAMEIGNKWYDYLDDLVVAGNKQAIELEQVMYSGTYGARFHPNFGDLMTDFLKKEGFDGMNILKVPVPDDGPIPLFDDYFISFSRKSVTSIVD